MTPISHQLASRALAVGAISLQPKDPFTWASGYRMPIYNDNRLLLGNASDRALVAKGFSHYIKDNSIPLECIAGTATAGIPHATTLADALELPLVYVRAKAKDHGKQNRIEGPLKEGAQVVVIEDLVSTGGSSISAVEALREAGAKVSHCLSIFSYGFEKAVDAFSAANCKTAPLFTFSDLLEAAVETKYINESEVALLRAWQQDPFGWGESHGFPKE